MEANALENDQEISVANYPMKSIYSDTDFNCRGVITPLDVIDLAQDVQRRGLQQPISIRRRTETTPSGYDYVIISGHRRYRAYQVNGAAQIPAILKAPKTEFDARSLNAIENIKRKDLNKLQEAKAIEHYKKAGWNREKIAAELGVSTGWVQERLMILELPPDIQEGIAANVFTSANIRDLYTLRKNPTKMYDAARKVKDIKARAETRGAVEAIIKKPPINGKRRRDRAEMMRMMETIVSACGGYNLATRVIAWANAEISTYDFYLDLKKIADSDGRKWEMPEW